MLEVSGVAPFPVYWTSSVAKARARIVANERFTIPPKVSVAAHAERIGRAIDVVKPRRDQRDLQDAAIVKATGAQLGMIFRAAFRRVFRQLHYISHHLPILSAHCRRLIVSAP